MKNKLVFAFLLIITLLASCLQNNNVKIVKSFINYSNLLDVENRSKLLSEDFDKDKFISLGIRLDSQSVEILKERIVIDDIQELDKNTIITTEHYEDVFSDYFELEMMSYEFTYIVANSKIISIEMNRELANNNDNIRRYQKYMETKSSFSNWFQEAYPQYNNYDFLVENGLHKFIKEYSSLPDSVIAEYHVSF